MRRRLPTLGLKGSVCIGNAFTVISEVITPRRRQKCRLCIEYAACYYLGQLTSNYDKAAGRYHAAPQSMSLARKSRTAPVARSNTHPVYTPCPSSRLSFVCPKRAARSQKSAVSTNSSQARCSMGMFSCARQVPR